MDIYIYIIYINGISYRYVMTVMRCALIGRDYIRIYHVAYECRAVFHIVTARRSRIGPSKAFSSQQDSGFAVKKYMQRCMRRSTW